MKYMLDAGLRASGCQLARRLTLCLMLLLPSAVSARGGIEAGAFSAYTVARIELLGYRHTRPYVIEREIRTRVGEALQTTTLAGDVQRLENLDIFSSVRVELIAEGVDKVRVVYHLRELPPVVPYISYDVGDQDGWSFGPAVKSVNFLGRDVFLAGYALFGGRTSYLIDLVHPWMFGDHVSLDLDASRIVRQNDFDGFEETSSEFTPRLGTWFGDHLRSSVALSYLRFESDLPGHTLSVSDVDDLFRVGASIGYDSRDDWSNPNRGWWTETQAWKTGGVLPGAGDFWTLHLDGRRFQSIASGHTLVFSNLLSLQSGRIDEDVPQYMDYHLGGANSLRGYAVDDLGHTLFGTQQWLTTMEYRLPIVAPTEISVFGMSADLGLGGTLFVDGGLAWSDREDLDLGRARFGVGAGLRLLIPAVDMSRLEIGYSKQGFTIHFATFSKMRAQRLRLR